MTCGRSSNETLKASFNGLDSSLVGCSRSENRMFSARVMNGMLTAAPAVKRSASESSFLFDMSPEFETRLANSCEDRN